MKTLRKMNGNKYLFYLLVAGIFGIMFLLNHYTFYAADDYSYMNSFATHKKIQTVWDIFPSMYAHAKGMNGRLVAHFFVQLFLLLPSGIFDVVNAVIFTMLILILYRYLFWNKKRNALALVSIFVWSGILHRHLDRRCSGWTDRVIICGAVLFHFTIYILL